MHVKESKREVLGKGRETSKIVCCVAWKKGAKDDCHMGKNNSSLGIYSFGVMAGHFFV